MIRLDQRGFTVSELVVVMVLTLFFSGMIMTFAIDYWGSATSLQNDNNTLITRQDAGDRLRDQLNRAAGLMIQNSIADPHANVSDPAQASGSFWAVLHAVPKSHPLPAKGEFTPVIYYTSPSTDSAKATIMNGVQPYYDEFVLYLDGSTKEFLLRTLANPAASGNRLVTSCPPAEATATCPADRTIASDVYAVETRYFSRSGNQINYESIVDVTTGEFIGPDFPAVEVVELTIRLKKPATIKGASETSNSTIIRVALRNG